MPKTSRTHRLRRMISLAGEHLRFSQHLMMASTGFEIEPTTPPSFLTGVHSAYQSDLGRVSASIVVRMSVALLLLFCAPLIGFMILLVRATSRGPGLFRQLRVGKDGHIFVMYKIRTMIDQAEAETGPVWTIHNDPRLTPVGRMLRRFHLDELPQLLNVVLGNMAIIGPRPERPEFVTSLRHRIPNYFGRLEVLPGITGLAQINLPPDSDLESVRKKLILDLRYIDNASWLLRFRILMATLLRLLGLPIRLATSPVGLYFPLVDGEKMPRPVADVIRTSQMNDLDDDWRTRGQRHKFES